ncbi:hypothetical protein Efla_001951 [Eimeria flavescens]
MEGRDLKDLVGREAAETAEAAGSAAAPPAEEARGGGAHALVSELFALTGKAKLPGVCDYLSYLLQYSVKCIVFAHHLAVLDAIFQHVTQTEKKRAVQIDGRTPQDQREFRVREFQSDPNCMVAVLSITACGQGLDLTAAGTVVFAELFWVPGYIVQAEDRSHRIGNQHKSVQIHYLIGENTIDDAVYRMLQSKWGVMTSTLDGKQQQLSIESCSKHAVPNLSRDPCSRHHEQQQQQQRAVSIEGYFGGGRETEGSRQDADSGGEQDDPIEILELSPLANSCCSNDAHKNKQQQQQQQQQQPQQQQQQKQRVLPFLKRARVD